MQPSEEEKTNIINPHVQVEYNKLKECYAQFNSGPREPGRGIYSDCFLLHARNLIDFLCKNKKEDDVSITDFIKNNKYFKISDILPIVPNKLEKPYERINKQLSHITYARLDKINQYNFFGEDEYYKIIFKNITRYITKYNDNVIDKRFKIKI